MKNHRWLLVAMLCAALVVAVRAQTDADKDKKAAGSKVSEAQLVERLLAARKEYQLTLEELRKHYIRTGDLTHARWAEDELLEYHRMSHQAYLLVYDVPPPTLKGSQNVPEANKLYRQAMSYKDKGWGTSYVDNQRRAEILFQKILTEYPQSEKISNTAFQLGELYESKAFKQPARAAAYYERCFEWNPKTHFDARIRAARMYDRQLNQRDKAAAIYKEIVSRETNEAQIEEARKRLQELSARR
jgi:hypothetical protein